VTDLEMLQRAKLYISKLAQGIDPISDREIEEGCVLHRVQLVRCLYYVSDVLQNVIDHGYGQKTSARLREFSITPQQLSSVRPERYAVRITEFVKLLHCAAGDPQQKTLSPTRITDWLVLKGFLENLRDGTGKRYRIPTEAGKQIGLRAVTRSNANREYVVVLYELQAQQFLLDHYWEIVTQT